MELFYKFVVGLLLLVGNVHSQQGCTCDTPDKAPDNVYTCQQQTGFGKCIEEWMISGGFCCQSCRYDVRDYCTSSDNELVTEYLNYMIDEDAGSGAVSFATLALDVLAAEDALLRAIKIEERAAARALVEAMARNPGRVSRVFVASIEDAANNPTLFNVLIASVALSASRSHSASIAQVLLRAAQGGYSSMVSQVMETAASTNAFVTAEALLGIVGEDVEGSESVVEALETVVAEGQNAILVVAAELISLVAANEELSTAASLIVNLLNKGGDPFIQELAKASEKDERCEAVGEALSEALVVSDGDQILTSAISKMMALAPCLEKCCGTVKPALLPIPAPTNGGSTPTEVSTPTPTEPETQEAALEESDALNVLQEISEVIVDCPRLRCTRSGDCCGQVSKFVDGPCEGVARRPYRYIGVCRAGGQLTPVAEPIGRGGFSCYCDPQ